MRHDTHMCTNTTCHIHTNESTRNTCAYLTKLQCDAVYCSVLQCGAVCCSVLQRVATSNTRAYLALQNVAHILSSDTDTDTNSDTDLDISLKSDLLKSEVRLKSAT